MSCLKRNMEFLCLDFVRKLDVLWGFVRLLINLVGLFVFFLKILKIIENINYIKGILCIRVRLINNGNVSNDHHNINKLIDALYCMTCSKLCSQIQTIIYLQLKLKAEQCYPFFLSEGRAMLLLNYWFLAIIINLDFNHDHFLYFDKPSNYKKQINNYLPR